MNEIGVSKSSTQPVWKLLLHAAARVESQFEAELAGTGLSLSKIGVLGVLVDAGEPMPLSRLACRLSCVKSNVTQLVDRLEADGLVTRVPDPSDRRSVLASITDTGRERFEAGRAALESAERNLFGSLSAEERVQLGRMLEALGSDDCAE